MSKYLFIIPYVLYNLMITPIVPLEDDHYDVYIVVSEECPICQNLKLELQNINQFEDSNVDFHLVFPFKNSNYKSAALFKQKFQLDNFEIILDQNQSISKKLGATVVPEAFIVDRDEKILYQGRIDNRYTRPGKKKHGSTKRDLWYAMIQATTGAKIKEPWPEAVGCFITYQK